MAPRKDPKKNTPVFVEEELNPRPDEELDENDEFTAPLASPLRQKEKQVVSTDLTDDEEMSPRTKKVYDKLNRSFKAQFDEIKAMLAHQSKPNEGDRQNRPTYSPANQRPNHRNSYEHDLGRNQREQTEFSESSRGGTYKLKKDDCGIFNPSADDPKREGILSDGKNTIYTDVYSFVDRIQSLAQQYGEEQVLHLMPTSSRLSLALVDR
jgi:hypothetical protein